MATRALPRRLHHLLNNRSTPLILGLSASAYCLSRQQPHRLDSTFATTTPFGGSVTTESTSRSRRVSSEEDAFLNADLVRQLSSGSLGGFLAGLLVSVFSKTLVLLAGMSIAVTQAAQSYGIDILGMLRIKQMFKSSKVLTALSERPAFNVAFGTTFALAAFFQF